jgi:serine/threonine-protein kinase
MAPEQMISSRDVTAASDLYAVGAMLFRAAAGEHAFGRVEEDELARRKLVEDAPPLQTGRFGHIAKGLEAVVARALRRRPADRYPKAQDMLAELTLLQDLARLSDLDLDATTTFSRNREALPAPRSSPGSAETPWGGPESSPVPAPPPAAALVKTIQLENGRHERHAPPPSDASRRSPAPMVAESKSESGRFVPVGLVAVLVGAALGGGALLGSVLTRRADVASARQSSEAAVCPPAAPDADEASGKAITPVLASEPSPIDLGEIDEPAGSEPARAARRPGGAPADSAKTFASASAKASARPNAPPVDKIQF